MAAEHPEPTSELERDVADRRERIDDTLRQIQSRLTPGQMVDEILHHGRGAGTDFVANLGRTLSGNPIPTALVGVGLLWLLLSPKPAPNVPAAKPADPTAPRDPTAS